MRNIFDKELGRLRAGLIDMCGNADILIKDTAGAVRDADRRLAQKIIGLDDVFDRMESSIEQQCINLIARQQPLARDLRIITAILKIITDVERIADLCADICETVCGMEDTGEKSEREHIADMCERGWQMFTDAVRAYKDGDSALAKQVCRQDDTVDAMFREAVAGLSSSFSAGGARAAAAADLMFIAKYAERVADHCTNIAEWVIFINDGIHPDLNPHAAGQS